MTSHNIHLAGLFVELQFIVAGLDHRAVNRRIVRERDLFLNLVFVGKDAHRNNRGKRHR